MQTDVRRPAVAGQFYTDDPARLEAEVDRLLECAPTEGAAAPKAVIAPHAGFMFSGPVAATAYRRLRPGAGRIQRVIILGPSHFVPVRGLAVSSAQAFAGPLGDAPVDTAGVEAALQQPSVSRYDPAHAREHSIETQIPFIQRVLGDVAIVPLVVGDATAAEVASVLAALWGGPETAIAISSDLSHFYPDIEARRRDEHTAQRIEACDSQALGPDNACGFLPIAGLLNNVTRQGAAIHRLDLRTSADAGAPRHSVVGYGAFEMMEGAS